MTQTSQNRVAAGTGSHGGEFAAATKAESTASLATHVSPTMETVALATAASARTLFEKTREDGRARANLLRATVAASHPDARTIVMERDTQNDRVRFEELRDAGGNPIDTNLNLDGRFADAYDHLLEEFDQLQDEPDEYDDYPLYALTIDARPEGYSVNAAGEEADLAASALYRAINQHAKNRVTSIRTMVGERHPDAVKVVYTRDTSNDQVRFAELLDGNGDPIDTPLILDGYFADAYDELLTQLEQVQDEENTSGEMDFTLGVVPS